MARKLISYIEITDDFDRNAPADETVELAVDGMVYELDLSSVRAKEIREFLAPYQEAAHDQWKLPARPGKKRKGPVAQVVTEVPKPRDGVGYAAKMDERKARKVIREWAVANGHKAAPTGKIPAETLEAFMTDNPEAWVPESTLRDAGLA